MVFHAIIFFSSSFKVFNPGLRSPPSHQGYSSMIPGLPSQSPYQPGFELMHHQLRGWNAGIPGHNMPPPGAQFAAPTWQPRTDPVAPTPPKKRRRRASSKSSNGGNSDTGYTSELSSPALVSPSKTKTGALVDNSHPHKSQVIGNIDMEA